MLALSHELLNLCLGPGGPCLARVERAKRVESLELLTNQRKVKKGLAIQNQDSILFETGITNEAEMQR
jgi:hypothetical protein